MTTAPRSRDDVPRALVAAGLLLVLCGRSGAADDAPRFVPTPGDPSVWVPVHDVEAIPRRGAAKVAATPNVWHVPGFVAPGAAALDGTNLYVTNHLGSKLVSVVDVQTFGGESIVGTIATPVDPIDLAVAGGELWVLSAARDAVHHRPLAGGAFSSVPLPSTFPIVTYGDGLHAHPDGVRLFVVHPFDDRVLIVDRTSGQVVQTITDLHHVPQRLVFFAGGARMAALSVGLDAPSCSATGPHVAVYDVAGAAQRLFEIDVHGQCATGLAELAGALLVARSDELLAFDGTTGAPLAALDSNVVDVFVAAGKVVGPAAGNVQQAAPDLAHVEKSKSLLAGGLAWSPPFGEMVAAADGRLFVCNRNDGALTVVDLEAPADAYGAGCPGTGDVEPTLGCVGTPTVGAPFSLDVAGGLGGASAWLFVGADPAATPLGEGCVLVVEPVLAPIGPFPLAGVGPAGGSVVLPAPVPVGTPLGTRASLQAFVLDPGGALGFSSSNGLELRVE
ncbi:MAG: YncE family protein [Planctomycetota bacterium JB042]